MIQRKAIYKWSFLNRWFAIKAAILALLWFFNLRSFWAVKDLEPLKGFVPFEILGVPKEATLKDIKKAYRKLSRELHPDKNRDNPKAVNDFMQVTKAYTVSSNSIADSFCLDFDRRHGPRELREVRQPRRSRQLPGRHSSSL